MKLAIPIAPRAVRLHQVPGALLRLAVVCAGAVVLALGLGWGSLRVGAWLSKEQGFFDVAQEVDGTLISANLPPPGKRDGQLARLSVLYLFDEREHQASGVATAAEYAEGLGPGARLKLLVDPANADHPREARHARATFGVERFLPVGIGLGVLLAALLIAWELRRALTRELAPLKLGMLVWLTPEGELPETRRETTFAASYWKQDVQYFVKARARPGRAPVRNGEKVLAAVVPSRPTWVRVIDEDLAKTLGWFQ